MKQILLNRLTIHNFKGCANWTLELNGQNADIYGKNGVGKTTVYDAFTWLLFGKDSRGNAPGTKEFQIKPLGQDGEVLDHSAVTEAEAVLSVSGQELMLKRTYYELWSKKRGKREATFDGHSSDFFVDGLPVKKSEYEKAVAALADETTLRTLTDVTWFCGKETEQNRRTALFDLIGGVSEDDVLASDPAFRPLEEALKGKPVEDYRKSLLTRRKALNSTRSAIPARLDECRRTVGTYDKTDFAALRAQRVQLQAKRDQAQAALDTARADAEYSQEERYLQVLQGSLDALEQQNQLYRTQQRDDTAAERLKKELDDLNSRADRLEAEHQSLKAEGERLRDTVQRCREEYVQNRKKTFADAKCPTCGQSLPTKQLAAAKKQFESQKKLRGDDLIAMGSEYGARLEQCNARQAETQTQMTAIQTRRKEIRIRLQDMLAQTVTDLPGYSTRRAELMEKITAEQALSSGASAQGEQAIVQAEERFRAADQALGNLDQQLAGEQVLANARRRIAELNAEARTTAEELERVDTLLELCDRFTAAKAGLIDQKVNGLFRLVKWKLFDTQVNGGVVDCCLATIDGVSYGAANDGAKVKAGIDVIETMSQAKGLRVPLFIDRAESVTEMQMPDTQVIRLIVSENEKELRLSL